MGWRVLVLLLGLCSGCEKKNNKSSFLRWFFTVVTRCCLWGEQGGDNRTTCKGKGDLDPSQAVDLPISMAGALRLFLCCCCCFVLVPAGSVRLVLPAGPRPQGCNRCFHEPLKIPEQSSALIRSWFVLCPTLQPFIHLMGLCKALGWFLPGCR